MTTIQTKTFFFSLQILVGIFIVLFSGAIIACSNSETIGTDAEESAPLYYRDTRTFAFPNDAFLDIDSIKTHKIVCDTNKNNLPLDDLEHPYAGIPRIVIETEKHREIKDRETDVPAKLQIWGEISPESEVMDLTIKGRGNSSWGMPKKSYKIEFVDKQQILGMPKDRDWALISNYADKTLMKNYLMYHLSSKLGAYYAPRCEFIELYINKEYLGIYLFTETIKIAKKE